MNGGQVLTMVVCGAGPAQDVDRLIAIALDRGWRAEIVATPAALSFIAAQICAKVRKIYLRAARCDASIFSCPLSAHVNPLLEVFVTADPVLLEKKHDPETDLNLMDPGTK